MSRGIDVYIGPASATMFASTLARGRAVITVWPGTVGIDEVLLAESSDQHRAAAWAGLAARSGASR